jgi:hypothetical protein
VIDLRPVKPARKAHFTPEESVEVARLARIYDEARASGDIEAFAKAAEEIANYLMAVFGAFEGEA